MSNTVRDEEMWSRLSALYVQVEGRLATAVQRGHGLGLSEFRALGFLREAEDGELRMQDLSNRLGLNQSSVTRLVGRLDAAGLAYRDLCPDDRRGVYTVITDEGRARYDAARGTYRDTLAAALDESDDDTVAALRRARV